MSKSIHGTYRIHVGNYDWGSGVDTAILSLEEKIESVDASLLQITERKMITDQSKKEHPLVESVFLRKVEDAYLCDAYGHKVEEASEYVCVRLYVSPEEGNPLACTGKTEIFLWVDPYELHIGYDGVYGKDSHWDIDPVFTKRTTDADVFEKKTYITHDGIRYDYAEYIPDGDSDVLYVWLHGLGEGQIEGSDAYLPLMGRKGTSMAGSTFQQIIGGARVVVPQCPTYWMDADGKQSNFKENTIEADGTSFYTPSLEEFIDVYAQKMNARKILLAGCSNGGYMCLMLAMSRPDRYAAVVPICEAVPDRTIDEEQIQRLKEVPLYFVYSDDDPIVPPVDHEIPTITRLREVGAKDLHASVTKEVIDTSGRYKDQEGNQYRYLGHLSWIYFDNNETDDGDGLSAWEWMRMHI